MQLAIITDIHFDVRNGSQYFIDKYREFFENQFFPHLLENNITTLLIGGDIWENRKKININTLHHVKKFFFDKLQEYNIKTYSILGNHDVVYKNTNKFNSLDFIEDTYECFNAIYDTRVINFDGVDIAFVSWINNENYHQKIKFIENCTSPYILGHFEIDSFEMTKGHLCEGGLSPKLFKHFEEVWSGHFHIKSKQGNIRYLGNPFQTNRGDIGYSRGFHVFDTSTKELTFFENEYNIYESIRYTDNIDITDTFDYEYYTNKIVILYVHNLLDLDVDKLNLFVDKLNKVCYNVEIEETNSIGTENIDVEDVEIKTTSEIISDYVDTVIEDKHKNNSVKTIIMNLYKDCIEES